MTIVEHIVTMDSEQCAKAWCQLNAWEYPDDFPAELKPNWWDSPRIVKVREMRQDCINGALSIQDNKVGYNEAIMDYLKDRTTEKMIRKYWKERYAK